METLLNRFVMLCPEQGLKCEIVPNLATPLTGACGEVIVL